MIDGFKKENLTNSINIKMMKTKITILTILFFGLGFGFAQNEEAMMKLSIFHEYVKAGNYDAAYEPWMEVRTKWPKFNNAIAVDGQKILEDKIEKSTGPEKVAFIRDLLKLWDEKLENFPSKTKVGDLLSDKAQLMYDYREELGYSNTQIYDAFDEAYVKDLETFKNAKSLYTYFSLMVDLYDEGKKTDQQLFDKYDDIVDKIEDEVKSNSEGLNKLIAKEDAGTSLTSKEGQYKRYYESSLTAFDQISGSIDAKLGDRANCSNLIPLYQKDFEMNKSNGVWLQRAMNKLYEKGCKEDPMFVTIVKQKNSIEPNAKTAYYLYLITGEQQYFDQTLKLENDPFKKAKLYNTIAKDFRSKGSYAKARQYYEKALQLNPSSGAPHLSIAAMYASSANSCGATNFNKRAVFWLAAKEAKKAGRVDPTLKSKSAQSANSYNAKAPSKSEIFSEGKDGETISIGCWISRSVTVPNL
jgi:tetratricopeptide (TPR) repeat protein